MAKCNILPLLQYLPGSSSVTLYAANIGIFSNYLQNPYPHPLNPTNFSSHPKPHISFTFWLAYHPQTFSKIIFISGVLLRLYCSDCTTSVYPHYPLPLTTTLLLYVMLCQACFLLPAVLLTTTPVLYFPHIPSLFLVLWSVSLSLNICCFLLISSQYSKNHEHGHKLTTAWLQIYFFNI